MKVRIYIFLAVILLILASLLASRRQEPAPAVNTQAPANRPLPPPSPTTQPIGDALMDAYADPETAPVNDLKAVGRVVEGMLTLFKNLDTRLISTNGELAAFLTGSNPEKLVYLSPDLPVFGPDKTLVDRWGSPYFIHIIGTGLIGIRMAGPDRELFTEDDLTLQPDGIIEHGIPVNP